MGYARPRMRNGQSSMLQPSMPQSEGRIHAQSFFMNANNYQDYSPHCTVKVNQTPLASDRHEEIMRIGKARQDAQQLRERLKKDCDCNNSASTKGLEMVLDPCQSNQARHSPCCFMFLDGPHQCGVPPPWDHSQNTRRKTSVPIGIEQAVFASFILISFATSVGPLADTALKLYLAGNPSLMRILAYSVLWHLLALLVCVFMQILAKLTLPTSHAAAQYMRLVVKTNTQGLLYVFRRLSRVTSFLGVVVSTVVAALIVAVSYSVAALQECLVNIIAHGIVVGNLLSCEWNSHITRGYRLAGCSPPSPIFRNQESGTAASAASTGSIEAAKRPLDCTTQPCSFQAAKTACAQLSGRRAASTVQRAQGSGRSLATGRKARENQHQGRHAEWQTGCGTSDTLRFASSIPHQKSRRILGYFRIFPSLANPPIARPPINLLRFL